MSRTRRYFVTLIADGIREADRRRSQKPHRTTQRFCACHWCINPAEPGSQYCLLHTQAPADAWRS